jgi:hypothetical protein
MTPRVGSRAGRETAFPLTRAPRPFHDRFVGRTNRYCTRQRHSVKLDRAMLTNYGLQGSATLGVRGLDDSLPMVHVGSCRASRWGPEGSHGTRLHQLRES